MPLTSTGYTTPTLDEIKSRIETEIRTNIGPAVDLSASSPEGQLVAILARQIRKVYEATAALYAATSPNGAAGVQLDALAALTGTARDPATESRVTATVNVDPGTYPAGTLVAHVVGAPDSRFENAEDVVNSGGAAADVSAVFVAQDTGPIVAPSGTLTEISGPVAGWNSITNPADATVGSDVESDAELRVRRNREIAAQGSSTVDAIASDISQGVAGVLSVSVLENDTDTVDANGLDPHSIEAIVYGPASPTTADDDAVAEQIFASKAAGTSTGGSTTRTVTDSQGYAHSISFTRPTPVAGGAEIAVETSDDYVGDTAAGEAIAAAAAEALSVGDDLDWSDLVAWAMAVTGVERVTGVDVGPSGGPLSSFGALSIDIREIATLSTGDITINSSAGTP